MADNSQTSEDDADVKQGLLAAYRRFMDPLARILIRNGISYDEFADELKGVFVKVAQRDFSIDERNPSGTRIAILTGLTRKEVKKQLELLDGYRLTAGSETSRVNRVLDGWHSDAEFLGPYGVPLELMFDEQKGDIPSFTELVRRYSGDMSPRAMLDELIRIEAVEIGNESSIRALTKAHICSELDPEMIRRMGKVIRDLADTLDFNNNPENRDKKKRFERTVLTNVGITESALADFSEMVGTKGQNLIETLDNFLTANEGKDSSAEDRATIKTGVSIFHYVESE